MTDQLDLLSLLYYVRENPPVLDKNEWEVIGIGQTIYTLSNTTQFGVDSCKVYCKCHMAIASCHTLKIQQVANPLHLGFSYWKCNPSQRPKAKFWKNDFFVKNLSPLKKVLSGPFFEILSIFFVNYTCVRTVWIYFCKMLLS